MSDLKTWRFALEKLSSGQTIVLLIVAESRPPAPGHGGFKMALCADGTMEGTIGGGCVEQEMAELARDMLRRKDPAPEVHTRLHHHAPKSRPARKGAELSGMPCGGSQTILLQPLGSKSVPAVNRIVEHLHSGTAYGVSVTPHGLSIAPGGSEPGTAFSRQSGAGFQYDECIALPTVYIIGGGHVALALSEVLSRLDFRIVVLDNRPDAPTMAGNRFAHRKKTIDYIDVAGEVPEGPATYVVIMTPSHQHDEDVLRRLIHKEFTYLGMMGSPPKVKEIFRHLRAAGIGAEELAKVHAPIGLPIHSHTAPEIAISIAAELISIKNGKKRS